MVFLPKITNHEENRTGGHFTKLTGLSFSKMLRSWKIGKARTVPDWRRKRSTITKCNMRLWSGSWTYKEHEGMIREIWIGVCGLDGSIMSVFISWFWRFNCGHTGECILFLKHTTLTSFRIFHFCSLCLFSVFLMGGTISSFRTQVFTFSGRPSLIALSILPTFLKSLSLCGLCYS